MPREHKKQKERERKQQSDSFGAVFAYIDRVYKEEKILLSYGKAVVRMQADRDAEERRKKKE